MLGHAPAYCHAGSVRELSKCSVQRGSWSRTSGCDVLVDDTGGAPVVADGAEGVGVPAARQKTIDTYRVPVALTASPVPMDVQSAEVMSFQWRGLPRNASKIASTVAPSPMTSPALVQTSRSGVRFVWERVSAAAWAAADR